MGLAASPTKRLRDCPDVARLTAKPSSTTDEGTVNLKLAFSLRHNNPAEMENESIGRQPPRLRARALRCAAFSTTFGTNLSSLTGNRRCRESAHGSPCAALVDAAESKETKSAALKDILYIPEVYDEAKRTDIASRRIRSLSPIMGPGKSGKKLMLLVGEMDRISARRRLDCSSN
jgi:hypothetical protein